MTEATFRSLQDVRCSVTVVLGTGAMTIRSCLGLRPNSIIALGQSAGEDLTLVAGGIQLARGEIVIIDDNAALRITEISPAPPPRAVA